MEKPILTEPGVKYFLSQSLKECRKFKDRNINIFFNIGMTLLFIFILGGILFFKYKGRPTKSELERKNREKQEYIVSKLQQIALVKSHNNGDLITDLPLWHNNPEIR